MLKGFNVTIGRRSVQNISSLCRNIDEDIMQQIDEKDIKIWQGSRESEHNCVKQQIPMWMSHEQTVGIEYK